LRQIVTAHEVPAVYVDSYTASLVPAIEELGIQVTKLNSSQHSAAFAFFLETVNAKALRHLRDDELSNSLAGASTRTLGEGKAWSRSKSNVPIDCLVACTLALWGAELQPSTPHIWGPSDFAEIAARKLQRKTRAHIAELAEQIALLEEAEANEATR